jgi:hypothetical protein
VAALTICRGGGGDSSNSVERGKALTTSGGQEATYRPRRKRLERSWVAGSCERRWRRGLGGSASPLIRRRENDKGVRSGWKPHVEQREWGPAGTERGEVGPGRGGCGRCRCGSRGIGGGAGLTRGPARGEESGLAQ